MTGQDLGVAPPRLTTLLLQQQKGGRNRILPILISDVKVMQRLARGKAIEDVLATNIEACISNFLIQSGQEGAKWSIMTPSNQLTDVQQVAVAIVMHLEDDSHSMEHLLSMGKVEGTTLSMFLQCGGAGKEAGASSKRPTSCPDKAGSPVEWRAALKAIKPYIPVRAQDTIVYTTASDSSEHTAESFEALPAGATILYDQCRFAGQPITAPEDERWTSMENLLSELAYYMMGGPASSKTVEDVKDKLHRYMIQRSKRIENGHAHFGGNERALQLSATSKDPQVERRAADAKEYHNQYGAMYASRKEQNPKLPKRLTTMLESYRGNPKPQADEQGPEAGNVMAGPVAANTAIVDGMPDDSTKQDTQEEDQVEDDSFGIGSVLALSPAHAPLNPPAANSRMTTAAAPIQGAPSRRQQQQRQQEEMVVEGGRVQPPARAVTRPAAVLSSFQATPQQEQAQMGGQSTVVRGSTTTDTAFEEVLSHARDYLQEGIGSQETRAKLLEIYDEVVVDAVMEGLPPTTHGLQSQGPGKARLQQLRTAEQHQLARHGRDQEAAAASRKGSRKTKGTGSKGGTGGKRGRQSSKTPQSESDEDASDLSAADSDIEAPGGDQDGPASRAGKRPRKPTRRFQR